MSFTSAKTVGDVLSPRRSGLPARVAFVVCTVCLFGMTACSQSTPADTTGGEVIAPADTTGVEVTADVAGAGQATIGALRPEGATAPATVDAAAGETLVMTFQPGTFARSVGSITPPDSLGSCDPSLVLPRPNAYKCTTEAGASYDPCFVIAPFQYAESSGSQMGCSPDLVAGSWGAIVRHNGALPETPATALDPIAFFVSLGSAYPACDRIEPRPLGDLSVSFQCKAPGAVLVDDLDMGASPWLAQYATTDSAGTTVTFGPEETPVLTAWVW